MYISTCVEDNAMTRARNNTKKNDEFLINGKTWVVEKTLGAGHRGVTFLVHNKENPNEKVCLKGQDNETRAREEAAAIAKYYGHNTEVAQGKHKHFYITMPYFQGKTLDKWQKEGQLTLYEKTVIASQLKDKLQELNQEHGYLHRDLKANNIIVDINENGEIKVHIIDLGRSISLDKKWLKPKTSTPISLFVEKQMAPEYRKAKRVGDNVTQDIGIHSDVYAYGKIFRSLFPEHIHISTRLISDEKTARMDEFANLTKNLEQYFNNERDALIAQLDSILTHSDHKNDDDAAMIVSNLSQLRTELEKAKYSDKSSIALIEERCEAMRKMLSPKPVASDGGRRIPKLLNRCKDFIISYGGARNCTETEITAATLRFLENMDKITSAKRQREASKKTIQDTVEGDASTRQRRRTQEHLIHSKDDKAAPAPHSLDKNQAPTRDMKPTKRNSL